MISAISGATLSASLRTGTTMETATGVLSEEGKSRLIVFSWMKEHQSWNKAGTGSISRSGDRFYGAEAPRATLLRRPDEGPVSGTMVPSRWIANPSLRAANQ